MHQRLRHIFSVLFFTFVFSAGRGQDTIELPPRVDVSTSNKVSSDDIRYGFREPTAGPLSKRTVSAAQLDSIRSDEDYWYANEAPKREKPKVEKETKIKPWVTTLFWVLLIAAFAALLVWFLATSNIRLFRKASRKITENPEEEPLTENIFELNFEQEIHKAVAAKNYRLAVRLLYLRTLRDLSNRNLVSYTHEKTNSDYLFQLAPTSYYKTFFRLTRSFDYTWYGQFELSEENFMIIQNDFASFQKQLS